MLSDNNYVFVIHRLGKKKDKEAAKMPVSTPFQSSPALNSAPTMPTLLNGLRPSITTSAPVPVISTPINTNNETSSKSTVS